MDFDRFFDAEFDQHRAAVSDTHAACREPFRRLVEACTQAVQDGGKILFFGNGGSASDAQHLATELTVRFKKDRAPIAALSLSTDTSALTAIGNDFSFEDLFSRQVEALCRPGDVSIGISTSGNSANVLRALEMTRTKGGIATGLAGRDGGKMVGLADPLVIVPVTETARIQEMHITLGHMLCGALETNLGLV